MAFDWRTTVLLVTGIPAVLAAIMALANTREVVAARLFCGLIVCWALLTTPYIIGFQGAYDVYPWLTFAPFNTELWIGPLWMLTVRALTSESLPQRWWFWLVSGVVQTLYYTACFFLIGPEWGMGEGAGAAKFAINDAYHEPFIIPIETALSLALIAYAAWDSWRRISHYRDWTAREHSNSEHVELAWLERSGAAVIALALMWFFVDMSQEIFGRFSYFTNFWFYAIGGVVVLWLALQFLARSDRRFPKPVPVSFSAALEYFEEPSQPRIDLTALEEQVRQGGWHFDQDLTLGELARRAGTNASALSAALNTREDANFTSFINGLRVEAVCDRLGKSDGKALNLLELALDCGFGSKATFNRAFKRHTGMTPREWIRRNDKG